MKVIITPADDLALEKVCIERAQAVAQGMLQDLEGLQILNRTHARLEAEYMDIRLALETIAQVRKELWEKHQQDFERTKSLGEVVEVV
ncbi:MAG TPA: hypothetical protein VGR97_08155 [Candidatus Acidoferrales bacterium]|nr:hypothetical protein [Candidatus Acidoferrales bacterium]